jgi:hypothetical protein
MNGEILPLERGIDRRTANDDRLAASAEVLDPRA